MLVSTCLWIILRIKAKYLYLEISGSYAPGILILESSRKSNVVCPLECTEKDMQNNGIISSLNQIQTPFITLDQQERYESSLPDLKNVLNQTVLNNFYCGFIFWTINLHISLSNIKLGLNVTRSLHLSTSN